MPEVMLPDPQRTVEIVAVEITVREHLTGEEKVLNLFVPAPIDQFCQNLANWVHGLLWIQIPSIPSNTLDEKVMESYCFMYAGYFEKYGEGDALTKYRTKLWEKFRDQYNKSGHPILPGADATQARQAFIYCMNTFLDSWKRRKQSSPYTPDG